MDSKLTLAAPVLAVLLGILVPVSSLAQRSAARAATLTVTAENPLPIARADETLSVAWATLRQRLPGARADRVRVIDTATGAEVVSQVLDADGDGQPDELLFQANFWPAETRFFRIEAAAPSSQPRARTYAHYEAHRDDVAWESDRVAFRIYGQGLWKAAEYQPLVSSGIDVWLKRTRDLIVQRWYDKGHDAYHLDTGEGADFYTVGQSLGAGGSAVWRDGKLHHARNFKAHRILASGPIRLVFELEYETWDAGGVQVSETKRITMDAGQNLFRQDITYRTPDAAEFTYAVGTVKRAGLVGSTNRAQPWAWMSTWGPVERKNGGHGSLGTAVLMPRGRVVDTRETDGHYLMLATAKPGETTTQYVGAGWTASGDFPDVAAWWDHLDTMARRLESPIRVTLGSVTPR